VRMALSADLRPSLALRHPWVPDLPRHPYLPKGAMGGRVRCATTVLVRWRVADATRPSEPVRVFADQFQRNGVILDRYCVRNGDAAAVSRGEQRALLPPLKSLQQTRPGMVG
jgi:hypothetical protein